MAVESAALIRIADFIHARLDDRCTAPGPTGPHPRGVDGDSRTLRALRYTVQQLRARRAVLGATGEGGDPLPGQLVGAFAWEDLRTIAAEWSDHPDYLPEFARDYWQADSSGLGAGR
ncbi:hypothetical protein [Streptomyces sp. WMMB303]|uniref:hypothetical protein n=1 Tax=Streptomyces sp. WMMB303 TaxID=3034154 RepID=UPI0023EB6538|nr:hypothetical protein [Streptomyces sp. WMMB303]MDF4254666.1 hypothetical protein [Streptomyces sp. WMMB303]MDF4254703.1 hypothetical protein [Streptomyces sp. WMMB303]